MKNMTKKGLSDVVTTVLIILLVLAAVVIIWTVVRPFLTGAGENIDMTSQCLNVDVKPTSCTGGAVNVQLASNSLAAGYSISRVIAIVTDSNGVSTTANTAAVPAVLASSPATIATPTGAKATAAAEISKDGKTSVCAVTSTPISCTA